jgi:hypothetical protein
MTEKQEKLLSELVNRLKTAHGATLESVILYGSGAAGDFSSRFSDLNVFCVLAQVGIRELEASEKIFEWWRHQGNPAPLLMARDEVHRSTDCFPIEFHDMSERRRVLFGSDVIATIAIDDRFYRAQIELELRAKVLRLRQKAAGVLGQPDLLLGLMADSLSTFALLARHALRLHGDSVTSHAKREVFAAAESRFSVQAAPFYTLLDLREGQKRPKDVEPRALFERYLASLVAMIAAVDRLDSREETTR